LVAINEAINGESLSVNGAATEDENPVKGDKPGRGERHSSKSSLEKF
jgi:hypothetical protein